MKEAVVDLMRPCGSAVSDISTLAEVALAMVTEHAREIPVTDADGNLLGVVDAEDIFGTAEGDIRSLIRPARAVVPSSASPKDAIIVIERSGSQRAYVVSGERLVGVFACEDALDCPLP